MQRTWFTNTSREPSANVCTSEKFQYLLAGQRRGVVISVCLRPATIRDRGWIVRLSEGGANSPCGHGGLSVTTTHEGCRVVVSKRPWAKMISLDRYVPFSVKTMSVPSRRANAVRSS